MNRRVTDNVFWHSGMRASSNMMRTLEFSMLAGTHGTNVRIRAPIYLLLLSTHTHTLCTTYMNNLLPSVCACLVCMRRQIHMLRCYTVACKRSWPTAYYILSVYIYNEDRWCNVCRVHVVVSVLKIPNIYITGIILIKRSLILLLLLLSIFRATTYLAQLLH
jgi:hypothetical protein